jgi:hypothetical protein
MPDVPRLNGTHEAFRFVTGTVRGRAKRVQHASVPPQAPGRTVLGASHRVHARGLVWRKVCSTSKRCWRRCRPGTAWGRICARDSAASSLYQQAKAHRNDARGGERAIDNDSSDANPAAIATAWREVKRLGVEALRTRSKDIEVACWVTEALIRVDGLPGLADGAALITGLCERYWDAGFPSLATEDGLEDRVIVLGGLSGGGTDGVLMTPIRRYPLFQRADGSNGDLYEWQRAEETASIADAERRQARIDAGVPDFDALQNEARASIGALRAAGSRPARRSTPGPRWMRRCRPSLGPRRRPRGGWPMRCSPSSTW